MIEELIKAVEEDETFLFEQVMIALRLKREDMELEERLMKELAIDDPPVCTITDEKFETFCDEVSKHWKKAAAWSLALLQLRLNKYEDAFIRQVENRDREFAILRTIVNDRESITEQYNLDKMKRTEEHGARILEIYYDNHNSNEELLHRIYAMPPDELRVKICSS